MRHLMRRRNAGRGFTLLELLIVIAIIGILASLIFGVIAGVMGNRRKLLAQKQVRDIAEAARQYFREHQVYPPDTDSYENGDPAPKGLTGNDLKYSITRYLGIRLMNNKTGAQYGPYLEIQERYLKPDSQANIDGKEVMLLMDPWGNAYEMDCMHVPIDGTVIGKPVYPYKDGTPKEEQTIEVKVWSKGPDGKSSQEAPFYPEGGSPDDDDNIMSWTTEKKK